MDAKLTLKLKESVIERAKRYASDRKTSLSRLIENYLDSLTSDSTPDFEISPFVKSIATGKSVPLDVEKKNNNDDYIQYQDQKHR
ncbi:DUF6364 family protein [Chryseobacterium suipulveris]|uniref:DUF6364 family protein n=1 Tax=Chryseobacterium suipulveris TaxID=2929800 RepID=A0ABY4BNU6_9FLAO|nr:DUF6364 family protein [Chryseobacterium suipulveris]UOE40864.1 DUF6364 family protein [Chryseobacterium suipulveris]